MVGVGSGVGLGLVVGVGSGVGLVSRERGGLGLVVIALELVGMSQLRSLLFPTRGTKQGACHALYDRIVKVEIFAVH